MTDDDFIARVRQMAPEADPERLRYWLAQCRVLANNSPALAEYLRARVEQRSSDAV